MKRFVLTLVMLSCATVGVGYAGAFLPGGAPSWAPWCMAIGTNGALMSLMAPAALIWTFIGMFVLCAGAFSYALAVPAAEGAGGALLVGLPIRTAVLLYSVGVAPIVILPFAYALTFDKSTLSEDDLVQVRAAHEAMKRGGTV
jgi:hypothetical protein